MMEALNKSGRTQQARRACMPGKAQTAAGLRRGFAWQLHGAQKL